MSDIIARVEEMRSDLEAIRDTSESAVERNRATIVLGVGGGMSRRAVHRVFGFARSTIREVLGIFYQGGVLALRDRRRTRAPRLQQRDVIESMLPSLVAKQPQDFGWSRSTWAVETVASEVERQTGVSVSRAHMGRLLHKAGCRRARPKPTVALAPPDRAERMQALREELWQVPAGDVVLFCDEVDIHLNPKVGADWAPAGQRKLLVTPGQNRRWYLAGAYNPHTKNLITVDGEKKTSDLFIRLACEVGRRYGHAGVVHLVVDNYVIHHSKRTREAVEALGGKIQLHFLPPYSPEDNPIERVWWDLHAHVTRNHRHPTIEELLQHVNRYIRNYSRAGGKKAGTLRVAA